MTTYGAHGAHGKYFLSIFFIQYYVLLQMQHIVLIWGKKDVPFVCTANKCAKDHVKCTVLHCHVVISRDNDFFIDALDDDSP